MNMCSIRTHGISRQLKISRRCIRQTIRKCDQLNTVATKPGGGCPKKITDREKRLIKLQQIRDDTLSLADLVRYARTKLNLSISSSTISRILREYNMVSFIAPRKPQITPKQRRRRVEWCYAHLNWSVEDWSRVIFSDESNYEVLNRKNRICIRRFRHDRTRFERSQKRFHRGGGICTYTTHIHLCNEHICQVNECVFEIQDKFSSMISWGVYNFGNPCT